MNDPDIYDWGEMRLVLQFLGQSIGDYCVIEDDNLYEVLTYVDVSYATHDNMRGRTGGCMKFVLKSSEPAITCHLVYCWICIWKIKAIKSNKTNSCGIM